MPVVSFYLISVGESSAICYRIFAASFGNPYDSTQLFNVIQQLFPRPDRWLVPRIDGYDAAAVRMGEWSDR